MAQGWKKTTLGKLVDIQSGVSPSVFQLSEEGAYPFVKVEDMNGSNKYQSRSRFYTNDQGSLIPAGSVIFPKRGAAIMNNKVRITTCPLYLDTNMMAISPNQELLGEFLFYAIEHEKLYKIADTSTIPQINNKHIIPYRFDLPPLPEQQKIAAILKTWDEAIEKTERLISQKEKRLQHVRSLLINNAGHDRKNIADIAIEKSERNRGASIVRVLSVTNKNGFVLPEDQFQRRVASEDVSNYKIVRRGEYAYNPSRINVGSIARLDDYDDGILSPMYIVFALNEKKVNSDYFLNWLSSSEARQRIRNAAQGSVRETVGFPDLCSIKIPLPDMATQNKIVEILRTAQAEIFNLRNASTVLKNQKRGLMQKLLTGEWRVKVDGKAMEAA